MSEELACTTFRISSLVTYKFRHTCVYNVYIGILTGKVTYFICIFNPNLILELNTLDQPVRYCHIIRGARTALKLSHLPSRFFLNISFLLRALARLLVRSAANRFSWLSCVQDCHGALSHWIMFSLNSFGDRAVCSTPFPSLWILINPVIWTVCPGICPCSLLSRFFFSLVLGSYLAFWGILIELDKFHMSFAKLGNV